MTFNFSLSFRWLVEPSQVAVILFREPPNAKGNWWFDRDHVHQRPLNQIRVLEGLIK